MTPNFEPVGRASKRGESPLTTAVASGMIDKRTDHFSRLEDRPCLDQHATE